MWVRLWIAFSVSSTVLLQRSNTRVHQSGAGYEWGWQISPGTGAGNVGAVGQYYVKLPESEQRVMYSADGSGYHGAAALNTSTHSSSFALGRKAIELQAHQAEPHLQQKTHTTPQHPHVNAPVDIYLLQQQLPTSTPYQHPEPFKILASATNTLQLPNYYYKHLTPLYNIQTQHSLRNNEKIEQTDSSKPLRQDARTEQTFITPVQVFKNHNCSEEKSLTENISQEIESDLKTSKDLFAEVPSYELRDINGNFGTRHKKPFTYRGQVSFKVETPRPNARNERFYQTTEASTHIPVYNETEEGINRLVASTQDLITNEDLLKINNAIEQHLRDHNDDLIKPRGRFSARNQNRNNNEILDTAPTTITVKAKIANILKGEIEHSENNSVSEHVLQSNSDEYKFSSPIVVAENNFNQQIFDNVVSTVLPYLGNGYEVVGIKNSPHQNQYNINNGDPTNEENFINVTPRPIGTNYLAPITVALRLLNSNDNDTFNYVDDHEAADSELVTDTVEKPNNDKTVVEVQESVPLAITHINDVEVHEYLDEGRSNKDNNKGAYEFAKNIYDNYIESVRTSKTIQDNMNKILLYKFASMNNGENADEIQNNNEYSESKEQLEPSENVQSQVEISPNGENNQRSEQFTYYSQDDYEPNNQKIIQPIIIEKQVPITKFVNRYIEKQVPYPETVRVPVPVDRPVPYAVHVEKVVEKPVEVTKYVDKPYPVEVPRPYPVEVKVPYPVQQKVYIDRPVHVPYPVEKIVEKQVVHPVAVPTPVGVPIEVPYPVEQRILYPFPIDRPVPVHIEVEKPVDRIVEQKVAVPYPVERRVPYPVPYETKVPVPYPVEKRIPVPVEKIVEKPVTVTQVVEKPVHIQVPVPHPVPVHVHHPYPVDRIVEKRVPYPVHVDRIVEKKVNVPYPVEKIVEKIVEKPVVVTKYINKPYPVEVKVPYAVEKFVEKKGTYETPVNNKVPNEYHFEKPENYHIKYRYGYKPNEGEETRNNPQYELSDEQKNKHYQHLKYQYEQYVKEFQKQKKNPQPVQSNYWGNQYASSYKYINHSEPDIRQQDWKKNQVYENYINYLTNSQQQNPNYVQNHRQHQYEQNHGLTQGQNHYGHILGQNIQGHTQGQNHHGHIQGQNIHGHTQGQNHHVHNEDQNNHGHIQGLNHHGHNQGQNQYTGQSQGQNQYNGPSQDKNQYHTLSQGQNEHNGQSQNQQQYNNVNLKDYYEQAQSQNQNRYWDKNKNNLVELKLRRTDRVPKVTIEYGGFRPPLIPSTEIDLDGMPVDKSE